MNKTRFKTIALNQAVERVVTLRDILRLAVTEFIKNNLSYGHGTDNAYDEAVYLILKTLHLPLDQLEPYLDAKLLDGEIIELLKILDLRINKRLPAPYITKEMLCQGYSFYVDERVIIPRSFIAEVIVNNQLAPWIEHAELVHNILDLCTGNGSLAVVAADYFPDCKVIASDISEEALEVAKINVKKYEKETQIKLCKSNLFKNLYKYKGAFDLILTNPPYVDDLRMNNLPPEYLHEPQLALSGGNDGLKLIDKILQEATFYLNDFGLLVVEMGDNQLELEQKYPGLNLTWLETKNNQGFVFVITKKCLQEYFG